MDVRVLQCLAATQDYTVRLVAEQTLAELELQPGYGFALVTILLDEKVQPPLRQLAGIVLRHFVRKHWSDVSEHYVAPLVSEEEKRAIRNSLPRLLSNHSSKLRTVASSAIGQISSFDFPEKWPELLPGLLQGLQSNDSMMVEGCLRCMVLFVEQVTDQNLANSIPILFPTLLNMFETDTTFTPKARIRALSIFRSCCQSIAAVNGIEGFKGAVKTLLKPTLLKWMILIRKIVALPFGSNFGLRLEALRAFKELVTNFSGFVKKNAEKMLAVVLNSLSTAYVPMMRTVINGDAREDDTYDSDGDAIGPTAYVAEMFDTLQTVVDHCAPALISHMQEFVHLAVGYCQLTTKNISDFNDNPTEYAAHEEDDYKSLRSAASDFLQRVLENKLRELAAPCVIRSAAARLQESEQLKSMGHALWWKLREVAVYALGLLPPDCELDSSSPNVLPLEKLLTTVLAPDLHPSCQVPFLRTRAIWCASMILRWPSMEQTLSNPSARLGDFKTYLLEALVEALNPRNNASLRMNACRASLRLCDQLPVSELLPALPAMVLHTAQLLASSDSDSLNSILEALAIMLGMDEKVSVSSESTLTPLFVEVWRKNVDNRMACEGVLECLNSLAKYPACLSSMCGTLLPVLLAILAAPEAQYSGTVANALDLCKLLVDAAAVAQRPLPEVVVRDVLPRCLRIQAASTDDEIVESCTGLLSAFLKHASLDSLSVNIPFGEPAVVTSFLRSVLAQTQRLLDPRRSDSSVQNLGGLVSILLFRLRAHPDLAALDFVRGLLAGTAARLLSAQHPYLIESLLLVFARLLHVQGLGALQLLIELGDVEVLSSVTDRNNQQAITRLNGLQGIINKWCQHYHDVTGRYAMRVITLALVALLRLAFSGCATLAQLPVQGYPVLQPRAQTGVKTRTQKQRDGDSMSFSVVAFPVKAVGILLSAYAKYSKLEKKDSKSDFAAFTDAIGEESDSASGNSGSGEDDSDDEEGEGKADAKVGRSEGKRGGGRGKLMQLSDLLDQSSDSEVNELIDGDEEDAYQARPGTNNDPSDGPAVEVSVAILELFAGLGLQNLNVLASHLPENLQGLVPMVVKALSQPR